MTSHITLPDQPKTDPFSPPVVYVRERAGWEYRRLRRDLRREEAWTEEELDDLGADGWELTGLFTFDSHAYAYFKRLKK